MSLVHIKHRISALFQHFTTRTRTPDVENQSANSTSTLLSPEQGHLCRAKYGTIEDSPFGIVDNAQYPYGSVENSRPPSRTCSCASTCCLEREQAESQKESEPESSRINPRVISDAILGLSDGLTVPFALSAGLSAFGDSKIVVLGSLAELVAGAISMGLGGYVGARSEAESFEATKREAAELVRAGPPEKIHELLHEILSPYRISPRPVEDMCHDLLESPEMLEEFLIAFYHKETDPGANRVWISALTLAIGYFVGGFIPLIPYFIFSQVRPAMYCSVVVMAVTLFTFGYMKTCVVRGWRGQENIYAGIHGGLEMFLVGGLGAGSAVILVQAIDSVS